MRAEVLSPERLNAFVFSGFAGIALLIAVVGVAGVLAFSVSARTREFGVRLAVGSAPRHLLVRVLSEGVLIAAIGIAAGAVGGYALARVAAGYLENVQLPGALPVVGAAAVLDRRRRRRVADAGGARVARRRAAGAPIGVVQIQMTMHQTIELDSSQDRSGCGPASWPRRCMVRVRFVAPARRARRMARRRARRHRRRAGDHRVVAVLQPRAMGPSASARSLLMVVAVFATRPLSPRVDRDRHDGDDVRRLRRPAVLGLALVAWAAASVVCPTELRRASMVAAILLACGVWR